MKLSLCLEMLFTDRPFIERMKAAAEIGYRAVEFWDWRNKDRKKVKAAAADLGLEISAFSGNRQWTMTNPADRPGLLGELKESLDVALEWNCKHLMLLTDRLREDGSAAPLPKRLTGRDKLESVIEALAEAGELAREAGVTVVLEPLNTRLDHRGYFLNRSTVGFEIVRRVNSPSALLLYDVYHMSMMKDDASLALDTNFPWLGYVHAADMPGRHEPGSGVIEYPRVVSTLQRCGYGGAIGLEFSPLNSSEGAARAAFERFGQGWSHVPLG